MKRSFILPIVLGLSLLTSNMRAMDPKFRAYRQLSYRVATIACALAASVAVTPIVLSYFRKYIDDKEWEMSDITIKTVVLASCLACASGYGLKFCYDRS